MADLAAPMPAAALPELTRDQKTFTLVGTLLGLFLAALDQTIVATAGPAIQRDLHIAPSLYAWITTSYLVSSTVFVPIYGKLSDALGRKRILVAGILIFLLGSVLCGLAQTTLQLVLFRAVQGIGAAALFTSAFAVIADLFPPQVRGKYQGLFGAAFGLSSVVGPLLGGFITDQFGWHWVFFINVPIGALALGFIFARMPPLRHPDRRAAIDLHGAAALLLCTVPLLVALSLGRSTLTPGETGLLWTAPPTLAMFAASAVGLVLFVLIERRVRDPILDLRLFRNRTFAVGTLAAFVTGAAFLGAIVFLPLFMVNVVGLSATSSGFTLTPLTLGIVFGNVLSGHAVSRVGRYKPFILGSLVILVVAFAVMAFTLTPESTQLEVTLKMIVIGIGLGPSIPLFTLAVQNSVPPPQIGVATSSATFARTMGSTIGVAILGTVFGASLLGGAQRHIEEATRELPPQVRAQLGQLRPGAGAPREGGEGAGIDPARLKAALTERFGAEVAGKLELAMKRAFTGAIRDIYRYTMLIALLGLLITLLLPELPLRGPDRRPPAAME